MAIYLKAKYKMNYIVKSSRKVMFIFNYFPKFFKIQNCNVSTGNAVEYTINIPEPELDVQYLCDPKNKTEIENNVKSRKGVGNITRVQELHSQLKNGALSEGERCNIISEFKNEAYMIPNKSYPALTEYADNPRLVRVTNNKKCFPFEPKEFSDITKTLNVLRTENLGNFTGQRSYYFMGELAEMEQALVQFSLQNLLEKHFQLISVPDILPRKLIESCGMNTKGTRTQVYELNPELHGPDYCLSGTSEMALAGYLRNNVFIETELPKRLVAVSRCYRAETSSIVEERGIYRVHQFTKVEMFGITDYKHSDEMLEEFLTIQEQTFALLGLHTQTLDMPPHELGAPAYRKYDVEGWLPGRKLYGELSSCSNCTDYQSRRLNIKYEPTSGGNSLHVHTVNGTACAVPRILIALLETHQQSDGTVTIPEPLQCYMRGKTKIGKQTNIPQMKFIKSKHWEKKHVLDKKA